MYYNIVDKCISEACKLPNYAVKSEINGKPTPVSIWEKYSGYRNHMIQNVKSKRLDRHKLASCLCGAILETQPLIGLSGTSIPNNSNEVLALFCGVYLIKFFMISETALKSGFKDEELKNFIDYLEENFTMKFPHEGENICDTQQYRKNIVNALYWSHFKCDVINRECFKYEPWAYATIFYHLEVYNKQQFENLVNAYNNI